MVTLQGALGPDLAIPRPRVHGRLREGDAENVRDAEESVAE